MEKKPRKLITVTGGEKISVQVDIIMTIFSKTYSATNGNLGEKMF
jgi:hypothetical protein